MNDTCRPLEGSDSLPRAASAGSRQSSSLSSLSDEPAGTQPDSGGKDQTRSLSAPAPLNVTEEVRQSQSISQSPVHERAALRNSNATDIAVDLPAFRADDKTIDPALYGLSANGMTDDMMLLQLPHVQAQQNTSQLLPAVADCPKAATHVTLPGLSWPVSPSQASLQGLNGDDTQTSTGPSSPCSPIGGGWSSVSGFNSVTDLSTYASGANTRASTPFGLGSESGVETGVEEISPAKSAKRGSQGEGEGALPPPKKKSHARKQPEGHIKRARNAFILFRKHVTDSKLIPPSVEVKHQNISVVVAKMWKEAPLEVRAKFNEQARLEKEEHQRKYPGYRYQPVFRRPDIIRRRVRKDPAEDDKVEAVAEALIKGKTGDLLEHEIKEQLVSRSEASDSDAESSRGSTRSRRRRDVGQLSKGAIRAQKAQARAKQMRHNLLGTNLLNMSLYNAATHRLAAAQQQQQPQTDHHQHLLPHEAHLGYPGSTGVMQYAHAENMGYTVEGYVPLGFDLDGRPIPIDPGYPPEIYALGAGGPSGIPQGAQYESQLYRLPPIEGMMDVGTGYETWQPTHPGVGQVNYWEQPPLPSDILGQPGDYTEEAEYPTGPDAYYPSTYAMADAGALPPGAMEYRLPPLLEASREGSSSINPEDRSHRDQERPLDRDDPGPVQYAPGGGSLSEKEDRTREWTREVGQQTPSGHVVFTERLFDGALGTAGLQDRRGSDEELGMFDQAVEQAGEVEPW
ncbi:hypothetical protein IAU60_005598 [Kwoniella sp. DSM 27419]